MSKDSNSYFWNPWGNYQSPIVEKMVLLDSSYLKLTRTPKSPREDEFEIIPETVSTDQSNTKINQSPSSQTSTKTWIEQQQVQVEQPETITFFQGFRAAHPKIVAKEIKKTPLLMPTIDKSDVQSTTSRISRLPAKARHQTIAINNIAKLFSELLNEREVLVQESDDLEHQRVSIAK